MDACTPFDNFGGDVVSTGCSVPSEYGDPRPELGNCCVVNAPTLKSELENGKQVRDRRRR